jgi:hypothetical protein
MSALHHFVQPLYAQSPEWTLVLSLAKQLKSYLSSAPVKRRLAKANLPGASSSEIETIVRAKASELGFRSDLKHLFKDTPAPGLRPDFYLPLKKGTTGIIIEVERGKTIQNNMDLLDFWKCHICKYAHYLFLVVPMELKQNAKKSPSRPYSAVLPRMAALFQGESNTNVRGIVVFGY